MRFSTSFVSPESDPVFVLSKDNWNDWFIWHTMYSVTAVMPDGSRVQLGAVKIGQQGMSRANATTQIPDDFTVLDTSYFSIGQDENYYETLISMGEGVRVAYLAAMRDCAFSLAILEQNHSEPIMQQSLLRDIDRSRVSERFHRLAIGQAVLTSYSFEYRFPDDPSALMTPPTLSFEVRPSATPTTNIHVLIGRNGVGKTRCFDLLARTFLGISAENLQQPTGILRGKPQEHPFFGNSLPADPGFAGLVTVSFSAFDTKGPLITAPEVNKRYAYVGLVESQPQQRPSTPAKLRIKSAPELADEFAASVLICREGVRRARWKTALKVLEADPLFAEANLSALAEDGFEDVKDRAQQIFGRLSSGHSVVLLSITRLVELVEERSLVLIDEPEGHLHPPLLAAYVRALSDLLTDRNGVAIVATHSPVVLQEVPRLCVWKLNRVGRETRADRPDVETFGENIGVLTREVFGLEVVQTGFHKLISETVVGRTYQETLAFFNDQLGAEGRALARTLSLIPPETLSDEAED